MVTVPGVSVMELLRITREIFFLNGILIRTMAGWYLWGGIRMIFTTAMLALTISQMSTATYTT